MTILEKLQRIQLELKAPKNQFNSFGKYKYRSAEDILEAIKPFEEKYSVLFKISDELREVAGKVFVHSEAKVIDLDTTDRESSISSTAQAIIDFDAKGMQMPQRTGAASSYSKKYSLGNLLLLDDTKDSDAQNTHGKSKPSLKLGSEEYKKVKTALAGGNFTLAQVKTKYVLSAEIEKSLV
tara:strand:- start:1317 stop:1859 length:543 start_codon:yes stop_codon:yes gene_type:complete